MRIFWALLAMFTSMSVGLLSAALFILVVARVVGRQNLEFPGFGFVVSTSAIIYIVAALDAVAFGLWVLARLRLRRRR
ncbi:MAG: hypothetical protein ABI999_01810 [Acidobacteriota bacterium]